MVDRQQILETVTDAVRDELDDDSITLSPTTKASSVEGWDSLAHVRIMIAIEQRFGVTFSTSEITNLKDVGALIDLLAERL